MSFSEIAQQSGKWRTERLGPRGSCSPLTVTLTILSPYFLYADKNTDVNFYAAGSEAEQWPRQAPYKQSCFVQACVKEA